MKSRDTGVKRILKAFTYSYAGFVSAFKSEEAFRQDIALCGIMAGIAVWLDVSAVQTALLFSSLLLILLMELVNTAIEVIIDRISEEYHELSKKAKDIGSLLVLLAFMYALIIWGAVLYTKFG